MESNPKRRWLSRNRKPVIWVTTILLAIVAFIVFFLPSLTPWRHLNAMQRDVDLFSGRVRTTRYLLCLQVSQKIAETPVSEALAGQEPLGEEMWVHDWFEPADKMSESRGIRSSMIWLSKQWQRFEFTPDAQVKSATQFLAVWREDGSGGVGVAYNDYLWDMFFEWPVDQPVTADDIPDDLAEQVVAARKARIAKEEREWEERNARP